MRGCHRPNPSCWCHRASPSSPTHPSPGPPPPGHRLPERKATQDKTKRFASDRYFVRSASIESKCNKTARHLSHVLRLLVRFFSQQKTADGDRFLCETNTKKKSCPLFQAQRSWIFCHKFPRLKYVNQLAVYQGISKRIFHLEHSRQHCWRVVFGRLQILPGRSSGLTRRNP